MGLRVAEESTYVDGVSLVSVSDFNVRKDSCVWINTTQPWKAVPRKDVCHKTSVGYSLIIDITWNDTNQRFCSSVPCSHKCGEYPTTAIRE